MHMVSLIAYSNSSNQHAVLQDEIFEMLLWLGPPQQALYHVFSDRTNRKSRIMLENLYSNERIDRVQHAASSGIALGDILTRGLPDRSLG